MAVYVADPGRAGLGVVDLRSVRGRDAVRSHGDDQRTNPRVPAARVSPRLIAAAGIETRQWHLKQAYSTPRPAAEYLGTGIRSDLLKDSRL